TTSDVYDPDEVVPQNSPLLKTTRVNLRPSPSPPPSIPLLQVSPPTSPGSRKAKRRVRPSQGDAVLVSFMDSGRRPDIANLAGTTALPSDPSEDTSNRDDSSEASDEEVTEQPAGHKRGEGQEGKRSGAAEDAAMAQDPPGPPDGGSRAAVK